MKYILSVIVLLSSMPCLPLFQCFKNAHEHAKLKESLPSRRAISLSGTNDSFLNQGNNQSRTVSLSLSNGDHQQRTFIREVPYKEFHQSGTWTLEVVGDKNECIEISQPTVKSPTNTQDPFVFSWQLTPKTKGAAIVRTTYTSASRSPHSQQFSIHVEA